MNRIIEILNKINDYVDNNKSKVLENEDIKVIVWRDSIEYYVHNMGIIDKIRSTTTILLKDEKQDPLYVYRYDNRHDKVLFQDYENGLFEDIVYSNLERILQALEIKRNSEELKEKLAKNNLVLYYVNKYFKI